MCTIDTEQHPRKDWANTHTGEEGGMVCHVDPARGTAASSWINSSPSNGTDGTYYYCDYLPHDLTPVSTVVDVPAALQPLEPIP